MKKYLTYLFSCIVVLVACLANAQETKPPDNNKKTSDERSRTIDSLLQVLKALTSSSLELKPAIENESGGLRVDTTIINTLNSLSYRYTNIGNYDQSLLYAQQAQQKAEKLIPFYKEEKWIVFLKRSIADAIYYQGFSYSNKHDYQKALDNYQKSVVISEQIDDKRGNSWTYSAMAEIYTKQNNTGKALDNYFQALKNQQLLNDRRGMEWTYYYIGNIYWYKGDYEKSLDNYLKSLKISEEIHDKKAMSNAYYFIGYIYLSQNNNKGAFENFSKALKLSEELKDKEQMSYAYNGLGDYYEKIGDYKKELENHLKCLKISEEIKIKWEIARAYGNIGNAYFLLTDYSKSLENYLKFLKLNEELEEKKEISDAYSSIGRVYLKLNKFQEAENYLNKSLVISKEIGYKEITKQTYSFLSELYVKKSDYKRAFNYQKLFAEIKDSLLNEQSSKQITEMNTRYESEKKDKEIQLLNKEKESQASLTAAEKRKQQVILFSVSGFSLLLMGFALLIYRSYRQKQLLNLELEKLSIVASETDNGVLICGAKGELEWCNTGLTRLLGYSLEELKQQGATLEEVSASLEIKSLIHQSIENKKSTIYQVLNITKDGRELWMQSTLTPILDAKGNIKKLVVIDTDVTERKKIEEKLNEQNTELEARTIEIERQKEIVEEKNSNITDSISYAQLIQQSILMEEREIQQHLPGSFIYYQPKDIVSGDFYWFSKVNDVLILAALDCTGHGVPGAFMSMIGNTLLNQIVNEKRHTKPSEILRLLNIGIYEALHQQKGGALSHDGMDMALCSIDYINGEVQYAGAQNPMYIVRQNHLEVIKADMNTIGGGGSTISGFDPLKRNYTNHIIPIINGMSIYLFSDGYMDQFGKRDRKKFGIQQFKDLILNNQQMSMQQQKTKIVEALEEWKGATPQIDDVLVIGVRL